MKAPVRELKVPETLRNLSASPPSRMSSSGQFVSGVLLSGLQLEDFSGGDWRGKADEMRLIAKYCRQIARRKDEQLREYLPAAKSDSEADESRAVMSTDALRTLSQELEQVTDGLKQELVALFESDYTSLITLNRSLIAERKADKLLFDELSGVLSKSSKSLSQLQRISERVRQKQAEERAIRERRAVCNRIVELKQMHDAIEHILHELTEVGTTDDPFIGFFSDESITATDAVSGFMKRVTATLQSMPQRREHLMLAKCARLEKVSLIVLRMRGIFSSPLYHSQLRSLRLVNELKLSLERTLVPQIQKCLSKSLTDAIIAKDIRCIRAALCALKYLGDAAAAYEIVKRSFVKPLLLKHLPLSVLIESTKRGSTVFPPTEEKSAESHSVSGTQKTATVKEAFESLLTGIKDALSLVLGDEVPVGFDFVSHSIWPQCVALFLSELYRSRLLCHGLPDAFQRHYIALDAFKKQLQRCAKNADDMAEVSQKLKADAKLDLYFRIRSTQLTQAILKASEKGSLFEKSAADSGGECKLQITELCVASLRSCAGVCIADCGSEFLQLSVEMVSLLTRNVAMKAKRCAQLSDIGAVDLLCALVSDVSAVERVLATELKPLFVQLVAASSALLDKWLAALAQVRNAIVSESLPSLMTSLSIAQLSQLESAIDTALLTDSDALLIDAMRTLAPERRCRELLADECGTSVAEAWLRICADLRKRIVAMTKKISQIRKTVRRRQKRRGESALKSESAEDKVEASLRKQVAKLLENGRLLVGDALQTSDNEHYSFLNTYTRRGEVSLS